MQSSTTLIKVKIMDQNPEDNQIQIQIPNNITVDQFKKRIMGEDQLDLKKILLKQNDRPLIDGKKSLEEYGVTKAKNMSVILLQKRGGMGINFNGLKDKICRQFSKDAPDFRVVKPGLVLQAKCKNKSCIAFGKNTLINKEYGEFDIAQAIHECICPICKLQTEPSHNFGYYKAHLFIRGMRKNQKVTFELIANDKKYHTFQQGQGKIQHWNYLKLVVKVPKQ